MKSVLINFATLALAFAVFFVVVRILATDVGAPPWFPVNIHEGPWLAAFLRLFGVLILAPPAFATLWSLFRLSGERERLPLLHDPTAECWTLELPRSMRRTMQLFSAGLAAGIVFALWQTGEPPVVWLFVSPLLLLCVYAGLVFSAARIDFDRAHVIAMDPWLRWHRHAWTDLVAISRYEPWQEFRLHFVDGRVAHVSDYFDDMGALIGFAEAQLDGGDHA